MSRVESLEQERRKSGINKSLSGRRVNVDKIIDETRERLKRQKVEEYSKKLKIRAQLADYFNKPEMLPEITPPGEPDPFEVFLEVSDELLKQVLDRQLG